MRHHSNVSIEYLLELPDARLERVLLEDSGLGLTADEARGWLKGLQEQGRAYVPMCGNTAADGRCLGHEEEG